MVILIFGARIKRACYYLSRCVDLMHRDNLEANFVLRKPRSTFATMPDFRGFKFPRMGPGPSIPVPVPIPELVVWINLVHGSQS
jgi:hypothetical protein